jgi:hypothetical protein
MLLDNIKSIKVIQFFVIKKTFYFIQTHTIKPYPPSFKTSLLFFRFVKFVFIATVVATVFLLF